MERHPIGNMMQSAMENLKDMVDVNTVIGDAMETAEGTTVIPFSRVSFGFIAGGGEYGGTDKAVIRQQEESEKLPFAGGSGAGVSVQPVGFLVLSPEGVKTLPAHSATAVDRLVELLPQMADDLRAILAPGGGRARGGTQDPFSERERQ